MGWQLDFRHAALVRELRNAGSDAAILVPVALVITGEVHIVLEGRTNLARLLDAFESLRDFADCRECLRGHYWVRLPVTGHISPGEHRLSDL